MTPKRSNGTLGGMASGGQRAVQRMRLARRVTEALLPQPDGVTLEAVPQTEVLSRVPSNEVPAADFVLSVLDMKIRLVLLVGRDSQALRSASAMTLATQLLREHADTDACALVADDEALSTRLVETGEQAESITSQASAAKGRIGPVRSVLEEHLRLIDPSWPATPSVLQVGQLNYEQIAHRAASDALEERRRASGLIKERQSAREKLSDEDADWAMSVSLQVASGNDVDLLKFLELASNEAP